MAYAMCYQQYKLLRKTLVCFTKKDTISKQMSLSSAVSVCHIVPAFSLKVLCTTALKFFHVTFCQYESCLASQKS